MSLRYPADRPEDSDFVTFQHMKYSGRGGGGGGEDVNEGEDNSSSYDAIQRSRMTKLLASI